MKPIKTALIAAAMAASVVGSTAAHAVLLNGSFTIDIYRGSGGGSAGAPESQALLTNPLTGTGFLDTIGYTGNINFRSPSGGTNTIRAFLESAGGTLSGIDANLDVTVSQSSFAITTLLVIRDIVAVNPFVGTINHDDGISIYDVTDLSTPVVNSASPTIETPTAFNLGAGTYRLVYAAANGLPEVLSADVRSGPSEIPEPSTYAMMLAGLGLLGLVARRRLSA